MDINPQRLIELEQNLRAAGLNYRRMALDELATYPTEIVVPILIRLLAEQDVGLRRLAVMGLSNHRSEAAFEALKTILASDGDASIIAEAANSIFDFGDRAIPLLHDLFDRSTNWLVRQSIISILVETDYVDVLLAIATTALTDETQTVKEIGILALGRVLKSPLQASALSLLTTLATDTNWRIRWRTAIALYGCSTPQAKQLIAQLQTDENFRVVAAALEGAAK